MPSTTYSPGPQLNTVRSPEGKVIPIPAEWVLLPPGDPALTRRVKAAGDHFVVAEKKGRKTFSLGVWAPSATIERIRQDLLSERSTDSYAKKQEAAAKRREKTQTAYVEDFHGAVLRFLNFSPRYSELAEKVTQAVTVHATPVGSGTVARTKRIPLEQRAKAAVIAWMRHQTTNYDNMRIARIKGERREVRRMLARKSHALLEKYRRGEADTDNCPLKLALSNPLPPSEFNALEEEELGDEE